MIRNPWILTALMTTALLISACASEPAGTPAPTPAETTPTGAAPPETPTAAPAQTPASTPDVEAVVRRVMAEVRAAETPTPTPEPPPTVDVEAITFDVMQRVLSTLEERQTPTPEPTPEPTPTPTPTPTPAPTPTPTPSLPAVIRDAQKSLVRITGPQLAATGIIVDVDAATGDIYVLTRLATVSGVSSLEATVGIADTYPAAISGSDETRDLALLRLCCDSSAVPLPLGDALTLEPGSEVIALEYETESGQALLISKGVVSSAAFDGERQRWVIWTDAPASGAGGGALITPRGRLVGLLIEGASPGFGQAISEITLSELLPSLR